MHTKAGAKAFARYYVQQINATGMKPTHGALEPLAAAGCESCAAYEDNVTYLTRHDLHNSGPAAQLRRTEVRQRSGGQDVFAKVDQLPINLLTSEGTVTESDPAERGIVLVFHLQWTMGGWRVDEIQKSAVGMPE